MKIGILGTGAVGQTIGTKLVQVGHDVRMGARTAAKSGMAARVVKTLNTMNTNVMVDPGLVPGDIGTARGTEMLLPIWLRLWATFKTPHINFHITRP